MARKTADLPAKEAPAFAHTPFARLAQEARIAAKAPAPTPASAPLPARQGQSGPPPRIAIRLESVGRSGKVITRIAGLAEDLRETVASHLRKALGCVARVDGADVILEGSLKERAGEWLRKIVDVRTLKPEKNDRTTPAKAAPVPAAPALIATTASGTYRRNVRAGMKVAIVLKEDQPTGELTTGVVRDLLTNSDEHPRGIKVRLQSGQVGRVKIIYA
jgi:uncharacterized repeat protein (TIGR03833 family)